MDAEFTRQRLERALAESRPEFGQFFLARFLDLDISYDDEARTCTVKLPAAEFLNNPQGSLHGGIIATAMDISMGHLCQRFLSTGVTVEMHTRYLRPIQSDCSCTARLIEVRGRTVLMESRLFSDEGALAAHATSTWLLAKASASE
jgi:acyl-CoA thioesterase